MYREGVSCLNGTNNGDLKIFDHQLHGEAFTCNKWCCMENQDLCIAIPNTLSRQVLSTGDYPFLSHHLFDHLKTI